MDTKKKEFFVTFVFFVVCELDMRLQGLVHPPSVFQ
jgi:hypothetical protein